VELVFEARPYDDPSVTAAVAVLQQEYVRRYGSQDAAVMMPAEFAEPDGLFLVSEVDGEIVAMGGWRRHDETAVEIKRMYVPERYRRKGYARAVLAELERRAAAAGYRRIVLNTGVEQPEAVAMYQSAGYQPSAGFGHYAHAPLALFFGKDL
jgi:GNAT superfamily N-acetyltransferase